MVNDSLIHATAGGVGGMIAMTSTYPLLTISMRAAVHKKDRSSSSAPDPGMLDAAREIVAREGVAGLYSGLSSSLVGISATNFFYYFTFEHLRDVILTAKHAAAAAAATSAEATIASGGALSTGESMLAGLVAGVVTSVLSNPIWVVNTRQTVREAPADAKSSRAVVLRKIGFIATLKQIVKNDGVLALWKGIGPALVLVINPILQYTAFEQLKNWLVKSRLAQAPKGKAVALTDLDFFLLGAISKLFATGLTYPQIVIKSRQQAAQGKTKNANVWTAMTDIVQQEGYVPRKFSAFAEQSTDCDGTSSVGGLYRGISSKLLQSVLTAAILFMSKERVFAATKKILTGMNPAPARS